MLPCVAFMSAQAIPTRVNVITFVASSFSLSFWPSFLLQSLTLSVLPKIEHFVFLYFPENVHFSTLSFKQQSFKIMYVGYDQHLFLNVWSYNLLSPYNNCVSISTPFFPLLYWNITILLSFYFSISYLSILFSLYLFLFFVSIFWYISIYLSRFSVVSCFFISLSLAPNHAAFLHGKFVWGKERVRVERGREIDRGCLGSACKGVSKCVMEKCERVFYDR